MVPLKRRIILLAVLSTLNLPTTTISQATIISLPITINPAIIISPATIAKVHMLIVLVVLELPIGAVLVLLIAEAAVPVPDH